MSIATLVLGSSGTGKSTSLRNLDPSKTVLIQCIKKPLPFRSKGWKVRASMKDEGNVFQTDDAALIEKIMKGSPHEVVVIDDFQAMLVNQLMARASEKGYDRFTDIGKSAWNLFNCAGALAPGRRVYILSHTQTDDVGNIRMKTVGKLVDQTLVPEGYFTVVLRTEVVNGQYVFRTQTNGMDCCKSPVDMFEDEHIPNDLAEVDAQIVDFYGVNSEAA
ncbi:ATP-binding protein [Achromobacter sp. GG226]|uniref:ATP-binding protein n=1 Tax=Verticiella alkaliphila TaxID=2779529 RepID=UPI001C0D8C4B|nr:ATP-binding protein [Verticiella sp. GG226]MBU4609183.1 ATP-binding protein [Verticiella sp. GG226]